MTPRQAGMEIQVSTVRNRYTEHNATVTVAPTEQNRTESDTEQRKGANAPLVFDGKIIRLTEPDHTLWKQTFSFVELNAYLVARDQFLADLPADDNRRLKWMVSTSSDLRNKNEEAKGRGIKKNGYGKYAPLAFKQAEKVPDPPTAEERQRRLEIIKHLKVKRA